jgi:hypothetical protein
MATITGDLDLEREVGAGKLYTTGDDKFRVLQAHGSWFEMGQQYGAAAKDLVAGIYDAQVQSLYDKKWMTEKQASEMFGSRVFGAASHRVQQLYLGVADGMGWPVEKVVVLDQSAMMQMYQGKLHAFAGCSSLCSWGDSTVDGQTYTGRNMDWGKPFLDFPLILAIYNPTDESKRIANLNWAGWLWAATAINDSGVYVDLHDGTAMGGMVVSVDRPSFAAVALDILAECVTSADLSNRFNGSRTDVSFIWTVADQTGDCFSYETSTLADNRRRNPEGMSLAVVNSFFDPDWGLHVRDTVSHSLERYSNLQARSADAHGQIDANRMMDIFDLRLFNDDGTLKKDGGVTKPTEQDADLTNYQFVTSPSTLDVWMKIPLQTEWRHVDLKALFV